MRIFSRQVGFRVSEHGAPLSPKSVSRLHLPISVGDYRLVIALVQKPSYQPLLLALTPEPSVSKSCALSLHIHLEFVSSSLQASLHDLRPGGGLVDPHSASRIGLP